MVDDLALSAPLVANLEGPVLEGDPWTRDGNVVTLANDPAALPVLRDAGLAVAGIANNHARDRGADPGTTAARLRDAGIQPAPAVLELRGKRIAVTAHDLSEGVPPSLAADLAAARVGADRLVATFHVGGDSLLPSPELRRAAEAALDAGASVVAAHGTHAIGPIERRRGAVIAWGLGNLAFACDCTDESRALLLHVTFRESALALDVVPIEAGLRGARTRRASDPEFTFELLEALGSSF